MNDRQKEVLQSQLKDEQRVLKELKQVYNRAREDVVSNIKALEARTDVENLQSIIYQKNYQEALKKQLDGILDTLNSKQFTTISDYLAKSYEDGFFGVMYDLHGQGIPLIFPINQKQAADAIQLDSKISEGLYKRLGVDTKKLKDSIRANVSRGIASNMSWAQVAQNIDMRMSISMRRSMTIARTEGHRIQGKAQFDAQKKAKSDGADVVKQWDSTLDKRTRPTHRLLDGQIREIEEPFEITCNGRKGMFPGGFGVAAEDINCRCASLQRAKWALDEDELQTLKDRAQYFNLDKTQDFEDFKSKYIKAVEIEKYGFRRIGGEHNYFSDSAKANPNYFVAKEYKINCQRCCPTYEMRRRGYDVEALPAITKGNDEVMNKWKTIFDGAKWEFPTAKSGNTQLKEIANAVENYGEEARVEIYVVWKRGSAHVFMCENVNGVATFIDPQTGKYGKEVEDYFSFIKPSMTQYARLDNLEPNEELVKGSMKNHD